MLFRLRHDAVVGGDDEEGEIDSPAPASMVWTKRSWPGTSMKPSVAPHGAGR